MNLLALLPAFLLLAGVATPAGASEPSASEPSIAFSKDDPALAWGPCPDFMPEGCEIAVLQGDQVVTVR